MPQHRCLCVPAFIAALALVLSARSLEGQTLISGTYDGATISGDIAIAVNTSATFTGGTTFTGTNATFATSGFLTWQQTGTLSGKSLNFADGAAIVISGANQSLTLDSTTTANGSVLIYGGDTTGVLLNQGTINHVGTVGTGLMTAPNFINTGTISSTAGLLQLGAGTYVTTNSGTVTADGTGTQIHIVGNFVNNGTITAQNSANLYFRDTNSTASLGTITVNPGSHAYITGTMNNTGATLNAPALGQFELFGGTITGGTIADGALSFTNSGGYLDGVTALGSLIMPPNSYVYFIHGVTVDGPALTLGFNSGIFWFQSNTLNGKTIAFGSNSAIDLSVFNNTLTFGSTTTVSGDVTIGGNGATIVNQGTITHNLGTGQLVPKTFVNAGSITASAGSLTLGTTISGATFANNNGALIRVTGGAEVHLQLPGTTQMMNAGTVDVQSGTFFTGNHLTNTAGGVISGNSTINGNVVLAGGTIAPGSGVGTLAFQSGTLAVTNASVFAVDINGATADRLVFQSPPSVVNIGSGLLTLSLTLLSAPTDNTTYSLIQINSGDSGLIGTFVDLPTSGSVLYSTFGGTTYPFTIDYQTNGISLTSAAIPEPSTYAVLLGIAAIMLVITRRRRP